MAARKKATKKAAKKAVAKTPARKAAAAPAAKQAKPKAEKIASKRFVYLIETPEKDEAGKLTGKSLASLSGPFGTESDALDDASIMAEADTTITVFRSVKTGTVQKSTKFVARK